MGKLFNEDELWALRSPGIDMIDTDRIYDEVKSRHIEEHREKYYEQQRQEEPEEPVPDNTETVDDGSTEETTE